ncbi:MAG TPA: sugar phosphate nucleotidyltransferase [Micavibrio sp.]
MQPDHIHPVILAGGPGFRLKPWSRPTCPKPFLEIGGASLLQATLARLKGFAPLILCQQDHLTLARAQATAITTDVHFLCEPVMRNTAPAIAAATAYLLTQKGPDDLMLVMPSDHAINRPDILMNAVRKWMQMAPGMIVAFGIKPRGPSVRFGYMLADQQRVRFVEKPDRAAAKALIKQGAYWHSGIFMARIGTMRDLLRDLVPDIWEAAERAVIYARHEGDASFLEARYFAPAPSYAIDRAVLEKAPLITMVPLNLRWRDLGTWPAMIAHLLRL